MRKFLCTVLTICMILNIVLSISVPVFAETSGECGTNLTWFLADDGTLTISGTGNMTNWSSYSSVPWYSYRSNIRLLVIDDGVTGIGRYAFYGCSGLTSVTIPDIVTSIGKYAFYGCSGLTSVTIPDSVTSIEDYTFKNCSGLTSAVIGNSVTSIGSCAFIGCSNLSDIIIPDSVTSIGYRAFEGCSSLTDIYYGGSKGNWTNISVRTGNTPLTNATVHYDYKPTIKENVVSVIVNGTTTVYNSLNEAIAAVSEGGKAAEIRLLGNLTEEKISSDCNVAIDLGGFNIETLLVTGNVNLVNGSIDELNVAGIVATENVAVTNTNALAYGTEGKKGVYTSFGTGVSMVDGAQVRIGGKVAGDGTIDAESGLRFISRVNNTDTLAGDIVSKHYANSEYEDGYCIGTMITAEESDAIVYIPATTWQDKDNTVYSAALTNLKYSNFNRKYTAQAYVEYNGVKLINEKSTTRSIYAVAAGLLAQSGEGDTQKLVEVLNAYVNQTGIRLVLADNALTVNDAESGKNGAYSGGAFFSVGETKVDGNVHTVILTPVGVNTKLDTDNFKQYIRINNNNSQVKAAVELTANDNGTYTLVFDLEKVN